MVVTSISTLDFFFSSSSPFLPIFVPNSWGPIFNSFHLMSIAVRNPVARNIFMAVIYPINQLKIAGVVALFLLYIFSTIQFFFFRSDFENGECDTLRSCLVYTVNMGMRSGGGVGENMAEPDVYSKTPMNNNGDWDLVRVCLYIYIYIYIYIILLYSLCLLLAFSHYIYYYFLLCKLTFIL